MSRGAWASLAGLGLVAIALLALFGLGPVLDRRPSGEATGPTAAGVPSPVAVAPTTPPIQPTTPAAPSATRSAETATPTSTAVATSTPNRTRSPTPSSVDATEAAKLVEALFGALDQGEYARAVQMGSGRGEEQIQAMVSAIETEAERRGVQPDLDFTDLALDATEARDAGRLVKAEFTVEVWAKKLGGLRFPVSTARSRAVFLVERVECEARVTDARSELDGDCHHPVSVLARDDHPDVGRNGNRPDTRGSL